MANTVKVETGTVIVGDKHELAGFNGLTWREALLRAEERSLRVIHDSVLWNVAARDEFALREIRILSLPESMAGLLQQNW